MCYLIPEIRTRPKGENKKMNEKELVRALTDEELAGLAGGYVKINDAGCYELYDEDGTYQWTFRGDQLQQLRKYAKEHGISDEFIMDDSDLPRRKANH